MQPLEVQQELALLRIKSREGTLSQEDCRRALSLMRESRTLAAATSEKAATKRAASTAKKNINSDDLLSQLDDIA
jgi:hypothetical protein